MKRILFIIVALLSTAMLTSSVNMKGRKGDKSIEALWENYHKAENLDQVNRMADLLDEIKAKARDGRASWDFYQAWEKSVNVRSRRNWKQRDSLRSQMRREIEEYDEPLLTYFIDRYYGLPDDYLQKVQPEASRLRESRIERAYEGMVHFTLGDVLRNDYEYVLWDLFKMSRSKGIRALTEVYSVLSEEIAGVYPQQGMADYYYALWTKYGDEKEAAMKALASEYEGRALALLPLWTLVEDEFVKNQHAGSEEYFKELKARVDGHMRDCRSYREGTDGRLAYDVLSKFRFLSEHLESKAVVMRVADGRLNVALRNLDKVNLRVSEGEETVFETVVENPVRSFYVLDSLEVALPMLDDGDYRIRCYDGKDELGQCHYPKYTFSVAVRDDSKGKRIYVADHKTGEPLDKVDVKLYKGDRKVAEVKDVDLDGFTGLPDEIASIIDKSNSYHYIVCSLIGADGMVRRSKEVGVSGNSGYKTAGSSATQTMARVLLDRAAFKPEETVKFKAVVYEIAPDGRRSTALPGKDVTIKLIDSQRNVLGQSEVKLNEFGSAAGEFVLDGIKRNGNHSIVVYSGKKSLGSASFVVDEFQLPSYDVTFEEPSVPFLPGETVMVKGCLKSFSGHSLASADVEASVMYDGKVIRQEKVNLAPDGGFAISFEDITDEDSYGSYEVEVKVTDLTGETLSFFCRRYVMRRPVLRFTLENQAEGSCALVDEGTVAGRALLGDSVARVVFAVSRIGGGEYPGLPLNYRLEKDGKKVGEGSAVTGEVTEIDFGTMESGLYRLVAEIVLTDAHGKEMKAESSGYIVKVSDDDVETDGAIENLFRVLDGDDIAVQFGVGDGPVWAMVELFADKGQLLKSEMVRLDAGQMTILRYDYKKEYTDGVRLEVLYFKDSRCHTFSHAWTRPVRSNELPLEFVRFVDRAVPDALYTVRLKTAPDSEVLASVFDVSTERIRMNQWSRVQRPRTSVAHVSTSVAAGMYGNRYASMMGDPFDMYNDGYLDGDVLFESVDEMAVMGYGSSRKGLLRSKSSNSSAEVMADAFAEDEAIPFQLEAQEVSVREDFAASLAFEPFLRPSDDGVVVMDFKTSDKISTFVVSIFAHDRDMNNSVLRREMLVTLPVKVDVVQPQYLHAGDKYVVNASVSSTSDDTVSGVVRFEVYASGSYDGSAPIVTKTVAVTVPAGGSIPVSFEVDVPSDVAVLGIKVSFSGEASDAVFVTVPVHPVEQTLTEAHSAVLLHGMSRESLLESLKKRFVNVSSAGAAYSEISVMDMLREALPLVAEAGSKDVVSQSEAMYVNLLAAGLRETEGQPLREYLDAAMGAARKVLACANTDGGFGWFEGMKSSPVVTAVILERYAGLRDRGLLDAVSEQLGEDALDAYDEAVTAAVKYLDSVYFSDPDRPVWYGRISLWQYLQVRTMYVAVPFDKAAAVKSVGAKEYKDFRKQLKASLVPKKGERWTDGAVLNKVRMIRVIDALTGSSYGESLAGAWGLKSLSKLRKSKEVELASLKEYAVEHPSGGTYYPNAVLPFRGLLESEAYAHAMICDLLKEEGLADMADGIRLWIMLQKETQSWAADPGFVEAMASVYDGSDEVKDTRVIVMTKRYVKPFDEIKAAGNGFTLDVKYYREVAAEGSEPVRVELKEGDELHMGERIIAVYSVWSQENRSFVRLSVPRAACFRPEKQLSGWAGGWLRPLAYGIYSVSPYSYREVKADRTLYWIDVFPEEKSSIEETLFVTQEGCFTSPVAEIESLYAPHYRANDGFGGAVEVK